MTAASRWWVRSPVVLFAIAALTAVTVLAWHDYIVTAEWRKTSELLLARRTVEATELLSSALVRDMRAAQLQVLATFNASDLVDRRVHELQSQAATAFAKFPYVESLFVWRRQQHGNLVFLNRFDRRPQWAGKAGAAQTFPVELVEAPGEPEGFALLQDGADRGLDYYVFEAVSGGDAYQVVVRYLYDDEFHASAVGAVGFTVNLEWVGRHYLPDLARQVARIIDADQELTIGVMGSSGVDLARIGPAPLPGSARRRQIPVLFADPVTVDRDDHRGSVEPLALEVGIKADPARDAAFRSAGRMAVFTSAAAVVLAIGLIMTARAAGAQARLSELRSDFVSTVTHNLKTPIASIRILAEALARNRTSRSPAGAEEYGLMLMQETQQLSRLVDNLLAYSRVSDVGDAYTFEPLALDGLVEKALAAFRQRLLVDGFAVNINLPDDLPEVRADATALGLVLVNVVDNAIRYSTLQKSLDISSVVAGDRVSLTIADCGDGISADEIRRIGRKFMRGRNAHAAGTGLGIALSKQIIRDHGGSWSLTSVPGRGTTVTIQLLVA